MYITFLPEKEEKSENVQTVTKNTNLGHNNMSHCFHFVCTSLKNWFS